MENNPKIDIYNYCCKLFDGKVELDNSTIVAPYVLDVYIPDINTGIEFYKLSENGETQLGDKNYHLKKLNLCKEKHIKLLQVYEDEYVNRNEIVYNKIKHILKKCDNMPKIMDRKCDIKQIDKYKAKEFLNTYHVQGFASSTIYLGCYFNEELLGVMTFREEVKGNNRWELTRFASNYNYVCSGIGGKLFKYFIRNFNPIEVKSFADRRWTVDEENNVYIQLNFKFDSYVHPDYHYFKDSDGIIRQHKFNFRKRLLNKKFGVPYEWTETKMVKFLGYERLYDCGLIKYVWKQ